MSEVKVCYSLPVSWRLPKIKVKRSFGKDVVSILNEFSMEFGGIDLIKALNVDLSDKMDEKYTSFAIYFSDVLVFMERLPWENIGYTIVLSSVYSSGVMFVFREIKEVKEDTEFFKEVISNE